MTTGLLKTKLHIPAARLELVARPHLIERLNAGWHRRFTLISAPAGFGKTTLVSNWLDQPGGEQTDTPASPVAASPVRAAWLGLDEGDNDLARFLSYLIGALRTVEGGVGQGCFSALQSPQPPPAEAVLTSLINDVTAIRERIVLVLDDYHLIEAQAIHGALSFLLRHLPPQMHLVIATREDPPLPLARLRARGHMTELRAADLRFTSTEAADFLNRVMGLDLSPEEVAALERRTEGWIAGLQMAAISMRGREDVAGFIESFTGSHRFVMDYLLEEVLQQQPESVQRFLLQTSILDRLCGPLCDAVCSADPVGKEVLRERPASGQETLTYLEQANLFIVPLDDERRWYRYHHLFADLLRQRLQQQMRRSAASSPGNEGLTVADLHKRASQWYEANGLEMEAFHHAVAAEDVKRAVRLLRGEGVPGTWGMPLHFRGAVTTILDWLASLPRSVLDARPWLWWRYASLLLVNGQTTGVEEKLQAAEAALQQDTALDDESENLIGLIAAARATLALTRYDVEAMIAESHRALEHLSPDSMASRSSANWTLGHAYLLLGDRPAARRALTEAIAISQAAGDTFTTILATIGLGSVQEAENQLHQAAETYRRVLQLAGDQPLQIINEAHMGLAHVLYQWNDLEAAQRHGEEALQLARQYDQAIDRFVNCEVFLARLKLAQGEAADAAAMLAEADQIVRRHAFVHRRAEVAAAQVRTLIHQGDLAAAAELAETHELPVSQARVHLAQGDGGQALAVLEPWHHQVEAKGWHDELLKVTVLRAVAHHTTGEDDQAVDVLRDALTMAEAGGFIRIFLDEGPPMAQLLSETAARGVMPSYVGKLLAAYRDEAKDEGRTAESPPLPRLEPSPLIEPLTPRELEVLELIAEGLSNREIGKRLFIALSTVKGHNQSIYGKLQVHRRTEALARARELGLL